MSEPKLINVALNNLYLNHENPRFDPVRDEAEAIAALCTSEQVLAVAESIARDGLNPLEFPAVTAVSSKDGIETGNFIVHEGNRRICALKLMVDPDKAPVNQKDGFRSLSKERVPSSISVVLFETVPNLEPWIRLLHLRDNNPSGRRRWDAEQQSRAFGETRNKQAMKLTDWAIDNGNIKKEDRKGTLSTVDRWIKNSKVKTYLGIKFIKNSDEIEIIEPREKSEKAIANFFAHVVSKDINTRFNKKDMEKWVTDQSARTDVGIVGPFREPENKPRPC